VPLQEDNMIFTMIKTFQMTGSGVVRVKTKRYHLMEQAVEAKIYF
jgi:hypothetical protein